MSSLPSLTELELVDLMLEFNDAKFLLDEVCNRCCLQLETLVLINLTKENYELLHPGVFLNLNVSIFQIVLASEISGIFPVIIMEALNNCHV